MLCLKYKKYKIMLKPETFELHSRDAINDETRSIMSSEHNQCVCTHIIRASHYST